MFNTLSEIKDLAERIPGYTVVYKIGNSVERIYYSSNLPGLLGYTQEEYKNNGYDPLSFIYEEDLEKIKDIIYHKVKDKEPIDISYRLVHRNGNKFWVRTHGNYIGDNGKEALYLTSMYNVNDEWMTRDIILDSSDRGVVVFDSDTKSVLYGNDKFFKFAKSKREECLGKACYNVVCKAGVYDRENCICFKAIGRDKPIVTHNPLTDEYFSITAHEITWGEHPAIIFYMSDVSAETKKDQEIKEKNEKLNKAQEEAIRNYKKQIEIITDGNSGVLSTCKLNFTKNICIPGVCKTKFMNMIQNQGTVDGYFKFGTSKMAKVDLDRLPLIPTCNNLLDEFNKGQETFVGDGYYQFDNGEDYYIRTTIHMAKNPITNDVEGVLYTRDLSRMKVQNDIMKCLMEEKYESISIINIKTSKVSVFSYNYDDEAQNQYNGEDYDVCRKFFNETYVVKEEQEKYEKQGRLDAIKKALDNNGIYSVIFNFIGEDKTKRLKTIEYFYPNELHNTIIAATRDITDITREQRQSMEELKNALLRADKATEAKSSFFSNISHDMRTPLNGILGFAGLGIEANSIEEAQDYFEKIKTSGEFLLKLINDTLDISKIESGVMKFNIASVNLDEMEKEITNSVEEIANRKKIKLVIENNNKKNTYVATDKLRLEQLLTNLIGNSIKFTEENGEVKFIIEQIKDKKYNFKFSIIDNGVGMKKEFVPHAFEAYTQDQSNENVKVMGTGLGLAIVKQIVTLMKGEIKLESEEGKGTRFDIYLPLEILDSKENNNIENKQTYNLKDKKILLCEDHPINRQLAIRLLEKQGMKITSAENGKIGLEIFRDSKIGEYDAILMDIRMPEMNGLEASEAIRKLDRKDSNIIPIIAMTANAYESDRKAAIRFGMNAHLSKPINPKILYQTLDHYINESSKIKAQDKWKPMVIIVDDIELNIDAIKSSIEDEYKIFRALDGKQALDILEKEAGIAAVITDIQMPGMDGIELIKKIRNNHDYDQIAILANTQHGDENQEEKLLAMGADDFIYKPTVPKTVLNRLNNVVNKYK